MRNPYVSTSEHTAKAMAERLGNRDRILDLGCGDGVLLRAVARVSQDASRLVGIDIEPERLPKRPSARFEYLAGDALQLPDEPTFDGIISNPPYLNVRHLPIRERERLKKDFAALAGQFDLAFAFVEKAIRLLEDGGRGVFLLPEGIKTRPAAQPLRSLLDQHCRWDTEPLQERPYGERAGVEAEILWFDCTAQPPLRAEPIASEPSPPVSVGIATGADSTFILAATHPWLDVIEACCVRPFIRGRDIVNSDPGEAQPADGYRLIVPYVIKGDRVSPVGNSHPGLLRFLDAQQGRLGNGSSRGPGLYIQCPAPALIGSRVVVPEIFSEPTARVASHGIAVLNSAFIVQPEPGASAQELAEVLSSSAGQQAIVRETRRLGSGYRRITARGLRSALKGLTAALE